MNPSSRQLGHELALAVALAAALFVLLLGGLLAWNEVQGKVSTLVNSGELTRLHEELRTRPKDEALKEKIRHLDLQLRTSTFYRLQLSRKGVRALLLGLAAFLVSAHAVRRYRRQPPDPTTWGARQPEREARQWRLARYVVAALCLATASAAWLLSLQPVRLPERAAAPPGGAPDFPSREEVLRNWPAFRGPNGSGVAPAASVPLAWDVKTGLNIRWTTAIPLHGFSSPIIWSNSVFLTGANSASSVVYRLDADSGALLWTAAVKLPGGVRLPTPKVAENNSLAAPTPVTDGRRVYAIFPNGAIAAFDFSGRQVWACNIGPLDNSYGYAASLSIFTVALMVQIDRGAAEDGLSKMLALDTRTGRILGQARREVAASWASPIVVEINGQPQLLTCAAPFVIAYDPANGKELWRNKCLESDVAPSPIYASNIVVAVAPNNAIIGLHPGETGIVWKAEDGVPDATSPVSDGTRLYIVNSEGLLTCYNLQTGKVLWTHEFETPFYASPTIAGNVLILLNFKGVAHLLALGDKYSPLGQGTVGEVCGASPVPLGTRLYIRGQQHLFCIESKP